MHSVASRRLRDLLASDVGWTQAGLARHLGVRRQAVGQWVTGEVQPKPPLMARIEDLLGIPMREWTERRSSSAKKTGTDD